MKWRWKIAQAAEIRWWKQYLKKQTPTAYLENKKNYWQGVLNELSISVSPQHAILDAGCGPAGIFIHFPNQRVDAVDPLLEAYAKELPHFDPKKYPKTRFFCAPLENWDAPQKYDFVFCLNAINHVENLEKSLDVIVNAVDKKGTLVISIDAHNHWLMKKIFQALPGDILHPHQYDLQEYQKMLELRNGQLLLTKCLKKGFLFNYYALIVQFS